MSDTDDWVPQRLRELEQHCLLRDHATDKEPSTHSGKHALDAALGCCALAVAALHRAGPYYTLQSENIWYFAAGTWNRATYEKQVGKAAEALLKRKSVADDVMFAEARLKEAVDMLQREGDSRDADDLEDAIREYKEGQRW